MLTPHPSPPRPPKGGYWTYVLESRGTFGDKALAGLVDRLKSHTSFQLLSKVEVEQLILKQMALHSPWMVKEVAEHDPKPGDQAMLREYIATLDKEIYVELDDYAARAEACKNCPCNRVSKDIDAEASRRLYLLARGKFDPLLGFCDLYHHHNAVACWIAKKPALDAHTPALCWVQPKPEFGC